MIYLDTHVVAWLYAGLVEKFTQPVRDLMNEFDLVISPIVQLELQYLFEINRITAEANAIVTDLSNRLGLRISTNNFRVIITEAINLTWTRDPFDRIIVAHASLDNSVLVSKDQNILDHYPNAKW